MDDVCLLGLDVGTSGCRAAVFTRAGVTVAEARQEYPLIFPADGWMELDAEVVTKAVFECIRECVSRRRGDNIAALAVSSQGEAVIPVDKAGKPLMNAIVTFDNRNAGELKHFNGLFGKEEIMGITGAPPHTMFSLTKIMWIKNARPDVYEKTWKFMCFGDYISYRLGAEPLIDYSMASRTMAFDIGAKRWSDKILGACGVDKALLPGAAPSGVVIGTTGEGAARETGLAKGVKIVSGGHDQVCCALSAGVLAGGMAMDSLGTTESILCVSKDLRVTPAMIENNIPCYCYPVNDLYAYLTFLSSSGAVLKWFRDSILGGGAYAEMDNTAERENPGFTGLMILPHFAGSGTPYLDFNSKGVIAGLTLGTTKHQIYKAIIEATCFESRLNIENMEQSGIAVNELVCVGGGAKSPFWLKLKADITGKPIICSPASEAGCFGAAILAGLGAGVYSEPGDAFSGARDEPPRYEPDLKAHMEYDAVYRNYKKLYKLSLELRGEDIT